MRGGNTLIKWPGGKSGEIRYIEDMIPPFERYAEPFFGGGALFFHLRPARAALNDISPELMDFYGRVKGADEDLRRSLSGLQGLFSSLLRACDVRSGALMDLYRGPEEDRQTGAGRLTDDILSDPALRACLFVIPCEAAFRDALVRGVTDKLRRTERNERRAGYSETDLRENLVTGFMSGAYLYLRSVYNDLRLGRAEADGAYRAAVFYWIREYCYGSMFRFNAKGEFNIPYGGMSYNRKDMTAKLDAVFSPETAELFSGAELFSADFEEFLDAAELTENDFLFADPPYDSDFSDYDGSQFTRDDHRRLAAVLERTPARWILVIKETDFIRSLYADRFRILSFGKTYTYNMRRRNDRSAQHLIITNLPE